MMRPTIKLRLAGAACCLLMALGSTRAETDAVAAAEGALLRGKGSSGNRRRLSQYTIPMYKGYPIDYCLQYETSHYGPNNSLVSHRGDGCGEPVADKFCQILGYAGSEFNTGIYYSSNATWVLGDDELNPRDEHMGKGEHTWFDRISCKHPQVSPALEAAQWITSAVGEEGEQAPVPEAPQRPKEAAAETPKNGSQPQLQQPPSSQPQPPKQAQSTQQPPPSKQGGKS